MEQTNKFKAYRDFKAEIAKAKAKKSVLGNAILSIMDKHGIEESEKTEIFGSNSKNDIFGFLVANVTVTEENKKVLSDTVEKATEEQEALFNELTNE